MATLGTGSGKVTINGLPYTIVPSPSSYDVKEAPAHGDVDLKLERRVIYRGFSSGIQKRREEPSIDATAMSSPQFSWNKQNKVNQGFYWANGCDTRQQDRVFCQRKNVASNFADPVEAPFKMGDASTFSWAVSPNAIWALQATPGTWTQSAASVVPVTDAVQYGGYLYVAEGNNNSFYTWDQFTTTSNWVQRTNSANNFVVIREQLWRSVNANIYSTTNTDPSNQVWSSATVVGDPNVNITYLDVWEDFLMIFKQDGIYNVDKTGNVYPLFPGFRNLGTNPRPLGQWRNNYFFAADVGLVWEVSKSEVKRIGFDLAEPYPMGGGAFSVPNASTRGISTTNYFIVGFNQYGATNTSTAYYLAWDGTAWHPFASFVNASADGLGMTGGNQSPVNPVLQFSAGTRGGNKMIYFQSAPLIDPFLSSSFDTASQVLYLTADNGALEDESKVLERVNIWLDGYSAGTVRIAYALDENIANLTFTDMGVPVGDKSGSAQQFTPPRPFPTYRKIQLRITLQANASTASPILRYVILHYKQRTPQRKTWSLELLGDKDLVSASGRHDTRSASKIIADLNAARIAHQQVQFIDILGKSHSVYVDEVGEKVQVLKGAVDPSFIVTVLLVESADEQIFQ